VAGFVAGLALVVVLVVVLVVLGLAFVVDVFVVLGLLVDLALDAGLFLPEDDQRMLTISLKSSAYLLGRCISLDLGCELHLPADT
jgi:hypothetical protein